MSLRTLLFGAVVVALVAALLAIVQWRWGSAAADTAHRPRGPVERSEPTRGEREARAQRRPVERPR